MTRKSGSKIKTIVHKTRKRLKIEHIFPENPVICPCEEENGHGWCGKHKIWN